MNQRVRFTDKGDVEVLDDGSILFFNFGDKARARQFHSQRVRGGLPSAVIRQFDVPKSYAKSIERKAILEGRVGELPHRPIRVDVSHTLQSFGLRPRRLEGLMNHILPGSGRYLK